MGLVRSRKKKLLLVIIPILVMAVAAPALGAVNDPDFPIQWGLQKVQAEPSWATSTGRGVVVAVLDTGIDFGHPEFAGKSAGSFNCYNDPCTEQAGDFEGHGTSVAGVIAAITNNDEGVASVAPDAKILSVRVCGGAGGGQASCHGGAVSRGIELAAGRGAKVINMSLGNIVPGTNTLFGSDDYQDAANKGAVIVVSSGNQGEQPISSYALAGDLLLVVGATGPNDEVADYTQGSANEADIDLYAPGGNGCSGVSNCITTTARRGEPPHSGGPKYRGVQGTSFAAPHVAGVAAQLRCLGKSVAQTQSMIKSTVDRPNNIPRLNAAKAVGAPAGATCAANFPVSTAGGSTAKPTQGATGGGAKPGQGQAPAGAPAGAPTQGQPGAPAADQNPTAGEIAKEAEEKKSNKTLINVLIGAVLVAAIGAWYGYSKWKAARAPAD